MFTSRSLSLKQLGSVRSGLKSVLARLDTADWLREQRATCFHEEQREQGQFNSEFSAHRTCREHVAHECDQFRELEVHGTEKYDQLPRSERTPRFI